MSITIRHLVIFVLVALTCGWAAVLVQEQAGVAAGQEGPGLLLWLVAPLLTIVVLRWRHGGWRDAGLRPRLRGAARWYAIAALIPLATGGAALGLAALAGGVTVDPDWSRYAALVAGAAGFNLVKNVFEEFAWRGYLASRLIGLRFGDTVVYVVSGLVWGLWHVPYYLVLLDGEVMRSTLDVPRPVFALLAVVVLMGWAVPMAELFRLSGSVWPPLLLHTVHNTVVDPIAAMGFVSMPTGTGLFFSPINGVVTALLWLAIGLWLRRVRLARERGAGAPADPAAAQADQSIGSLPSARSLSS